MAEKDFTMTQQWKIIIFHQYLSSHSADINICLLPDQQPFGIFVQPLLKITVKGT